MTTATARLADSTRARTSRIRKRTDVSPRPRNEQPEHVRGTPAGLFGERLAELMKRANVSATELAEAIDKSEDSVWGYMRGTSTPPINVWPAIAAKLGVKDVRQLLPRISAE